MTGKEIRYAFVCLHEHFLSCDRLALIELPTALVTVSPAAFHRQNRGRPSEGLAVLSKCQLQTLEVSESFVAVTFNDLAGINVYLPTNYGDQVFEACFTSACQGLAKFAKKALRSFHRCVITGDFNSDLTRSECPQSETIISMLPSSFSLLRKNKDFTYISQASTTSNLDHVLYSGSPVQCVTDNGRSGHQ